MEVKSRKFGTEKQAESTKMVGLRAEDEESQSDEGMAKNCPSQRESNDRSMIAGKRKENGLKEDLATLIGRTSTR